MNLKLVAAIVGLSFASSAQAVLLTGGVSLGGTFTSDNQILSSATRFSIGPAIVSGATGTFAALEVGLGDPVSFAASNPLIFSPITLPAGVLYTFGDGSDLLGANQPTRFTFTLSSLAVTPGATATFLELTGAGIFRDTLGVYNDTNGFWNASFNRTGTGDVATFGFGSSSSTRVPDGGATIALLGLSLVGLVAARRKFVA